MFYDHDILTSKKHGVATIWLVATLGSRSHLKKVTRKAILDVKIAEACQTIITPEAPMALRLQGSLLYGVSRVFSQQCGYILTDAQSLHQTMRGAKIMMRNSHIDPNVAATKSENFNLEDDPNFNINFDLSFDLATFGLHDQSDNSSILSPMTLDSSQSSLPIQELEDYHQLGLPVLETPDHPFSYFDLGQSMGVSSMIKSAAYDRPKSLGSEPAIYDNSDFQVNGDGDIMILGEEDLVLSADQITDTARDNDLRSDAIGLGEGVSVDPAVIPFQEFLNFDLDFGPDHDHQPAINDEEDKIRTPQLLPKTIPEPQEVGEPNLSGIEDDLETIGEAPQGRTQPHFPRLELDVHAELSNRDLTAWSTNYLANMAVSREERVARQSLAQAKRNAVFWVLDQGIGGVQVNFGEDLVPHPFSIFSGQALLHSLTGRDMIAGTKRSLSSIGRGNSGVDEDEDGRRVRRRSEEHQAGRGEDAPPIADEDGLLPIYDDYPESEVGRRRESSLKDQSSQMPWNVSSRHGSVRHFGSALQGIGSSIGGQNLGDFAPSSGFARGTSRLTSASPLVGRGRALSYADSVERDQTLQEDLALGDLEDIDFQLAADMSEEFQLHGPAAAVSTQTAAQSQWIAATLEKEAYNFLEFLRTTIKERERDQMDVSDDTEPASTTTFRQLLSEDTNSSVVAAQGFLHVLSLATKGLIEVEQRSGYGDIVLGVIDSDPVQA